MPDAPPMINAPAAPLSLDAFVKDLMVDNNGGVPSLYGVDPSGQNQGIDAQISELFKLASSPNSPLFAKRNETNETMNIKNSNNSNVNKLTSMTKTPKSPRAFTFDNIDSVNRTSTTNQRNISVATSKGSDLINSQTPHEQLTPATLLMLAGLSSGQSNIGKFVFPSPQNLALNPNPNPAPIQNSPESPHNAAAYSLMGLENVLGPSSSVFSPTDSNAIRNVLAQQATTVQKDMVHAMQVGATSALAAHIRSAAASVAVDKTSTTIKGEHNSESKVSRPVTRKRQNNSKNFNVTKKNRSK